MIIVLFFSSEIEPILSLIKDKPQPNQQNNFYLVFNRTDHSNQTFLKISINLSMADISLLI